MSNQIHDLVHDKLIDQELRQMPGIPISFRGQEITAVQLEILAKLLGYRTRSKFLADLVQAAINQACEALPNDLAKSYDEQLRRSLSDANYRQKLLKGNKK